MDPAMISVLHSSHTQACGAPAKSLLTVPEPPITAETPEGDNGRYKVEKTDDIIYVIAK